MVGTSVYRPTSHEYDPTKYPRTSSSSSNSEMLLPASESLSALCTYSSSSLVTTLMLAWEWWRTCSTSKSKFIDRSSGTRSRILSRVRLLSKLAQAVFGVLVVCCVFGSMVELPSLVSNECDVLTESIGPVGPVRPVGSVERSADGGSDKGIGEIIEVAIV